MGLLHTQKLMGGELRAFTSTLGVWVIFILTNKLSPDVFDSFFRGTTCAKVAVRENMG